MKTIRFRDVISDLKIEFAEDFIKDYHINNLVNCKTGVEVGKVISLQLSTKYDYDENTLGTIKERFEADDYYITVKRNQLHMNIKCYYKDEDRRTGAVGTKNGAES